MADNRPVFPILADVSGFGVDVSQMQQGFDPTGKNGLIGFAFKDSSGNVVLPQLLADGRIAVSTQSPGTKKTSRGELDPGSVTLVTVTGAIVTLVNSKTYADLNLLCSCRRASLFQVIWNDNGVETVLADAIVDAGQYTVSIALNDVIFTAGAVGTQQLIVKAMNFDNKLSNLRATVDIIELP